MKLLIRLWCLLFGHRPVMLTITYEKEGGALAHESKDLLVLQPAQNCNPLVLNVCARCQEPARHTGREKHFAKLIAEGIAAERAKKAAADAAADAAKVETKGKPLPPSPAPFETGKRKLRAVPKPPSTKTLIKPTEPK